MTRNLITRMGAASGVVAALVAGVFVAQIAAVNDLRSSVASARHNDQVVTAAGDLRREVDRLALARAGGRATRAQTQAAQAALPRAERQLAALVARDPEQRPRIARVQRMVAAGAAPEAIDALLDLLIAAERRQADDLRAHASRRADLAIGLGIGGVIGSAVLIALLIEYLNRYIVVPLRRVARAARRLAEGDLAARVPEHGDAEPMELARSFNTMAESLQTTQAELERQNAELNAQQEELERALGDLAAEKRRVDVFYRAGEQLAAELDLDALAEVALRELCDAAGAEVGALHAATPEREDELALAAVRGLDAAVVPGVLRPGEGLAGRAAAEGRTVTAAHGPGGPGGSAAGATEQGTASAGGLTVTTLRGTVAVRHEAHVPLRLGERLLGVVSLGRLHPDPLAPDELATIERLADQVAVAFANVLSYRRALRQAHINHAVLEATPDPIGLLDLHGVLVVENGPMAGLRTLALDGLPADLEADVRDELLGGPLEPRTYTRYAAPVRDATGALMGRIVVLRDISAERESERLKDEFFALVSHELRTPLTSIIGYLELVLDDEDALGDDARRFLEVVQRNARRLLRLVGDMLFVAQVEAGRLALERRTVHLDQVAAESVEAARPSAERGAVQLSLHVDPDVRPITGDADRCGQMLDNLVSNALKFTGEGGRVEVSLTHAGDRAVIVVADNGMGIPLAEQRNLFERFTRSSLAADRAVPGAGLGLAIVKTIVEAHGGTVGLDSREGAGTTVRVELPYRARAQEGGADAQPQVTRELSR